MDGKLKFTLGVLIGFVVNWIIVIHNSNFGIYKPALINKKAVTNYFVTESVSNYSNAVRDYIQYLNTLNIRTEYVAGHLHENATEAASLFSKVRILCCVFVKVDNLQLNARTINTTWGRHCNKLLFFSSQDEPSLPVVVLNITEGRSYLFLKTVAAFRYVYEHHLSDADFFLKADDDAFVVLENLRYFLSSRDPEVPVWYGRRFKSYMNDGYMSGGAGYVLSTGALKLLYTKGPDINLCYINQQNEDVGLGRCFHTLEIPRVIAVDNKNRTRMHFFDIVDHVMGNYPLWVQYMDQYVDKTGFTNISEYAISFHYIRGPTQISRIYNTIYNIKVFGKSTSPRSLN